MTYAIYPISILFTICFVFYSKYQFQDEKAGWTKTQGKWHVYGLAMRCLLFAAFFFPAHWKDVVLSGAICINLFEYGINVIALEKPLFYLGVTSYLDKKAKYKWIALAVILVAAVVVRVW